MRALPLTLYACHCLECQRQSSSAFGLSMRLKREALAVDYSALRVRERDAGRPAAVNCWFCPTCGVRILHERPASQTLNIKPGTLDETGWLHPVGHLWTDRAQPFVRRLLESEPDTLTYPRQPADYDDLIAAWRARLH